MLSVASSIDRSPLAQARWIRAADGWLALHPEFCPGLREGSLATFLAMTGVVVSDHRRTQVRLVQVHGLHASSPSESLPAYLKIHQRPARKDALFSLLRRGRFHSYAEEEWENMDALARLGIATPVPVALGVRRTILGEAVSFLVTLPLEARSPLDTRLTTLPASERSRALHAVVTVIARLHAAGFTHPDLYARHVYPDDKLEDCALLDVQRTRQYRSLSIDRRARDLAALDVSLAVGLVSREERLRFLSLYGASAGPGGQTLSRGEMRRLTRAILLRRKLLLKRGRGGTMTVAPVSATGAKRHG